MPLGWCIPSLTTTIVNTVPVLKALEGKVLVLEGEKLELLQIKNAMSADLEHLLMNRQEMSEIRKQLSTMAGNGGSKISSVGRANSAELGGDRGGGGSGVVLAGGKMRSSTPSSGGRRTPPTASPQSPTFHTAHRGVRCLFWIR
jgi:hypothetical protein